MNRTSGGQAVTQPRKVRERRCVGCGKHDDAIALVRLVVGPDGEIAVDLAGGSFGRGAHVHVSGPCLREAAQRGLSRSFSLRVKCTADELAGLVASAAERRIRGLLASANGAGSLVFGHDAVSESLQRDELSLVLVACDATPSSIAGEVGRAIDGGQAIAWGTKADLGSLVQREEVAVVGIRSRRFSDAIAAARRIADGARSGAEVR